MDDDPFAELIDGDKSNVMGGTNFQPPQFGAFAKNQNQGFNVNTAFNNNNNF